MSAVAPRPAAIAQTSRPWSWSAYSPAWLVSAALIAVLLAASGIVTTIYTHDLYVVFDGGWRTFLGQRPYVDFHSPIGFVYFLPYVLLRAIEPFSLSTLMHANVVVAVAFLLLATVTLPRRMSPLMFFLAALGIVCVVISPRSASFGPEVFSHLAPYNRWCEGAMMLMTALVLLPQRPGPTGRLQAASSPRVDVLGAAALTLLALFLFHIKITYFLCSLGLVVLGLVTRQMSWRTVALAAAFFIAASVLLELILHVHRPYFEDLEMARRATLEENFGAIKFVNKRWGLYMALAYLGATVLLLLFQQPPAPPATRFAGWGRVLVIAVGGSLIGAAANTQTHMQWEIPLMGTLLLVTAELIFQRAPIGALPLVRRLMVVLVLVLGAGTGSMVESAAIVDHTIASRDGSACPLPSAAGTLAEQLLFPRDQLSTAPAAQLPRCDRLSVDPATLPVPTPLDYHTFDSARLEVVRVSEAQSLLRGRLDHGERVMPMDFANPYSVFSRTLPANGALLWWDMGRNYSPGFHPDAQILLGHIDYVLESLYDPWWEPHGSHMWQVYGAEVQRSFQPVAEGRFWRLWQRKPG